MTTGTRAVGDGRLSVSVEETARAVGGYVWAERTLFEVVGRWAGEAAVVGDDSAREAVFFSVRSRCHGRFAELLADRLPRLAHLPAGLLVACPEPWQEIFGGLTELEPAGRRAALVDLVLPALVTGFSDHMVRAAPVADGAVVAVLRLAVADHAAAVEIGQRLL